MRRLSQLPVCVCTEREKREREKRERARKRERERQTERVGRSATPLTGATAVYTNKHTNTSRFNSSASRQRRMRTHTKTQTHTKTHTDTHRYTDRHTHHRRDNIAGRRRRIRKRSVRDLVCKGVLATRHLLALFVCLYRRSSSAYSGNRLLLCVCVCVYVCVCVCARAWACACACACACMCRCEHTPEPSLDSRPVMHWRIRAAS
jgi:hypothetical protein